MKKFKWLLPMVMVVLLFAGCKDGTQKVDQTEAEDENNKEDEPTIFDKIIVGARLDKDKPLYDFTDTVTMDGYEIICQTPYGDNNILVLYSGEEDSMAISYNISKGKAKNEITIDETIFSEGTVMTLTEDGVPCIYDAEKSVFCVLDIKAEKYKYHELSFTPETMIVTDGGESILFTKDGDCNVYQYMSETENVVSVYDATDEVYKILLKSMESDDNTLIVRISSDEYVGYARLSIELQEITRFEEEMDSIFCVGSEYIITKKELEKSVQVYTELKPRIFQWFTMEDPKELENFVVYPGSPYILTCVSEKDTNLLRFYSVADGIMVNYVYLSDEYTIEKAEYLNENGLLSIQCTTKDGNRCIIIWDVEAVNDVIK